MHTGIGHNFSIDIKKYHTPIEIDISVMKTVITMMDQRKIKWSRIRRDPFSNKNLSLLSQGIYMILLLSIKSLLELDFYNNNKNLVVMAMKIRRPWTTKHWCESVIDPEWPFAYAKYTNQKEERKGRVSSNLQDMRHVCDTRGVQSKCHICEDVNDSHFQLQGVSTKEMSYNIPTVTDTPWAVFGSHRNDFSSSTHVCMYMSQTFPCQSNFGIDYSDCPLRCWGHHDQHNLPKNKSNEVMTQFFFSSYDGHNNENKNHHYFNNTEYTNIPIFATSIQEKDKKRTTPWTLPSPTAIWSFPQFSSSLDDEPIRSNPFYFSSQNKKRDSSKISLLPQGFTSTLAGAQDLMPGFQDGLANQARYDYYNHICCICLILYLSLFWVRIEMIIYGNMSSFTITCHI